MANSRSDGTVEGNFGYGGEHDTFFFVILPDNHTNPHFIS